MTILNIILIIQYYNIYEYIICVTCPAESKEKRTGFFLEDGDEVVFDVYNYCCAMYYERNL